MRVAAALAVALDLFAAALGRAAGAQARAGPPRRIVSLAPSVTEILFALGLGGRVVGVSRFSDYPRAAAKLPRVGSFLSPNVEAVVAARPDLVVAVPSPGNRSGVEDLERLGLEVLVVRDRTLADLRVSIRAIARAAGVSQAGERLVSRIDNGLAIIAHRVAGAPRRRTLLVVDHDPLVVAGPGTLQHELIEMAGGENVAARSPVRWPVWSLEAVIAASPEVIVDVAGHGGPWDRLSLVPAVRDHRLRILPSLAVLRAGPRVVEALAELARAIHPERFEPAAAAREKR